MFFFLACWTILGASSPIGTAPDALPTVLLRADDTVVRESCRVLVDAQWIEDHRRDGVLRIEGDDVTVVVEGTLRGAPEGLPADRYRGYGIRVLGDGVTLRGARVEGFRAGIYGSGCDDLTVEDCDVSGNFRQRLRSTPQAEANSDWLWPHDNENRQWLHNYGAGIYLEDARGLTVRRNRARRGQNGLCLVRVSESDVYDNDFSWLSGWGVAVYRCHANRIVRNSLDFCVRGYSHGVYSRGQDSAGILFFEQNRDHVIAFNSATHGGDGFFGFAGKEALEGEVQRGRVSNNGNLIYGNDFSYAPAIGIEMTFSCNNVFAANRLVGGNYGIWGGYSADTLVVENIIEDNHLAGVAVEHGSGWTLRNNRFAGNMIGVQLWWDEDPDLLAHPWARFNPSHSGDHRILRNRFREDGVAIELRGGTRGVRLAGNRFDGIDEPLRSGAEDEFVVCEVVPPPAAPYRDARLADLPGERQAVGARPEWAGRHQIVITEWGPHDGESPYLLELGSRAGASGFRWLGNAKLDSAELRFADGTHAIPRRDGRELWVEAPPGQALPYELIVRSGEASWRQRGVAWQAPWDIQVFAWQSDPREDLEAWRAEAEAGVRFPSSSLQLIYASAGPSDLPDVPESVRAAQLPSDRFGTIARTELQLPAGTWRVRVVSDDGVRLQAGDQLLIDNWTWHAPTTDEATWTVEQPTRVPLLLEHFELDGYATLSVELEYLGTSR